MANLGTAYVQIVPSAQGISGSISNALNGEVTSAGKSAGSKLSGLLGSALKTGGALIGIAAIGSGVKNLIGQVNETNSAWKTFSDNMSMTGMSNSGIKQVKADLQDFAAQTIYSSKDMASTFSQLYAVNQNTTTEMVKGFGAVAAAAENPTQAMKTISQQATQMVAKPTVAWEDFKLMIEQSPAGMAQVASQMGMSLSELTTQIQDGKIKTEDFLGAFEAIGGDPTSDLMQMATQYKTIGEAADGLTATLATKLAPAFQVINDIGISVMTGLMDGVSSIMDIATESFAGVGGSIKAAAESIGTMIEALTSTETVTNFLKFAMDALAGAITFLADAANLIGIVITAVTNFFKEHEAAAAALKGVLIIVAAAFLAMNAPITAVIAVVAVLLSQWNNIKAKAVEIWNGVKNAIVTPLEAAKEKIKSIIDKIKGFFNITLSFKGIKLPHITVSWNKKGNLAKIASKLGLPGVPDFGVSWYKTGGIFNDPSVIGVGEAGPEAVVPLDKLWGQLDSMGTTIANCISNAIESAIGNVTVTVISELDGRVVAKSTAPLMDRQLGIKQTMATRGVI